MIIKNYDFLLLIIIKLIYLIDFSEFLLAISITSQNTDLRLKLKWIFKGNF